MLLGFRNDYITPHPQHAFAHWNTLRAHSYLCPCTPANCSRRTGCGTGLVYWAFPSERQADSSDNRERTASSRNQPVMVCHAKEKMHTYEVRPLKDRRGFGVWCLNKSESCMHTC